ncbi:GGDEF domain-containing protein [Methylophaga sp.]|uniref:GGDEF domain-containing protein n=1 Tax=Methylophaga sp. TaxID=2024840 RepID=UPI003A8CD3BD
MKTNHKDAEKWKEKFTELSQTLDKQKAYELLLERGLSRLALVSHGLDMALDDQLDKLRKHLRTSVRDKTLVESILEEIETAISRMDEDKLSQSTLTTLLIRLIDKIDWPENKKKHVLKLRKRAVKKADDALPQMLDELTVLIDECMSSTPKEDEERGLFSRFFQNKQSQHNLNKTNITARVSLANLSATSDEKADTTPSEAIEDKVITPQALLIELLERLSLPTEFSSKASELRLKIHDGLKAEDVPKTISSIADIVSQLSSSVMAEKKEYESFLRDLTKKITSLDKYLYEVVQEDLSAYEERHKLAGDVEQTMVGLRTDVESAADFEDIKHLLSQRLDHLNEQITHYQHADNTRFANSQKQIEALTQRLHEMESEANELRLATSKARALAMKDPLTGIWNRQALTEVLQTEYSRWTRYQKSLTMVIWDVDYFKSVNDKFGHSAGDVVLKTIARIFKDSTRQADFIARYGGEEFVGLFPEIDLEQALDMANKIRQTIEKTQFQHNGISVPITASAGLVCFEKGDTIEDVFKRADKALYEAKGQGRNNCQVERRSV